MYVYKKSYTSHHPLASVRCIILISLLTVCTVDGDKDGLQVCENTNVVEMRLPPQLSGCPFFGLELI